MLLSIRTAFLTSMSLTQSAKDLFHTIEGATANRLYRVDYSKIKIIGVTGTDGKTTTSHLIYHILQQSGRPTSLISSVYADIGGVINETGFHVTTPRPNVIRKYIVQAIGRGSEYFVLETTSHAIDQKRVAGIPYAIAVITNVTHEHLYHHKSFATYLAIKARLLLSSAVAIVNRDMEAYVAVTKILKEHNKSWKTYSIQRPDSQVDYAWDETIKTKLPGEYNKQNVMAAYAVCRELGLGMTEIKKALLSFALPTGRYDVVHKKDYSVIIDFAHTPNSIAEVLSAVREKLKPGGRLIHVFGAASQRDDAKRPMMGEQSGRYADLVILTEEDYRSEDPDVIAVALAGGLESQGFSKIEEPSDFGDESKTYMTITNRYDAIAMAIKKARKGDIVVLTGKGHEKSLNRNGKEYEWDEYEAVRRAIASKP